MTTALVVVLSLLVSYAGQAQDLILDAQQERISFTTDATSVVQPFQFLRKSVEDSRVLSLEIDRGVHRTLYNQQADHLEMAVPVDGTHQLILELDKKDLLASDFRVTTNTGRAIAFNSIFYHGKVKGKEETIAAVSIHKDRMIVFIKDSNGIYTLGEKKNTDDYVFYNEDAVVVDRPFQCNTDERIDSHQHKPFSPPIRKSGTEKPVPIAFFIDYEAFLYYDRNPLAAASHVADVFNQVAVVYAQYNIPLIFESATVWQVEDPYGQSTGSDADGNSTLLSNFGRYQIENNQLGSAITYMINIADANVTGRAYTGELCVEPEIREDGPYGPFGYARLKPTYTNFPTYSESVLVLAHELGHTFGSTHTHTCDWGPNRDVAIDNCVDVFIPNGKECSGIIQNDLTQNPNYAGTIMSYCSQDRSIAVNKAHPLEFHPEPEERIVNGYLKYANDCTETDGGGGSSETCWRILSLSAGSGEALSSINPSPAEGISMVSASNEAGQFWKLDAIDENDENRFSLRSVAGDMNQCLESNIPTNSDLGGVSYMGNCGDFSGQKWTIRSELLNQGVEFYTMKSDFGGADRCLTLREDGKVWMTVCRSGNVRQLWAFQKVDNCTPDAGCTDTDGDGICDDEDNCPTTANADQVDFDNDNIGDSCDPDIDGDGVPNGSDTFPRDASESKDTDGDGIGDNSDNCPTVANADQADSNNDAIGDACTDDTTISYCEATGSTGTGGDWINRIRLNTIDNASEKTRYSDFTDQSTTLQAGQSYKLSMNLNFSFPLDQAYAWIDFNKNGIFDTSERIPMTSFSETHESQGIIVVPANLPSLTTTMRVRVIYNSVETPDPCGNYAGEVEDYTIVVEGACTDTDSDGWCDEIDNCPTTANPDQADSDGDNIGDVCEVQEPIVYRPNPAVDGLENSIWQYGYGTAPGAFSLATERIDNDNELIFYGSSDPSQLEGIYQLKLEGELNDIYTLQPGDIYMRPGIDNIRSIIRFVAPESGLYQVDCKWVAIGEGANRIYTYVATNATAETGRVFDSTPEGFKLSFRSYYTGYTSSSSYTKQMLLQAGEELQFAVSDDNDGNEDDLQLVNLEIKYTGTSTAQNQDKQVELRMESRGAVPTHRLDVFPNPTQDLINIELPYESQIETIQIIDVNGKIVWQSTGTLEANFLTVDMNQFSQGLYYVQAQIEGETLQKSFVVTH
jgi:hypothetical protein